MSVETEAQVLALEGRYALIEVQNRQTGCGRCHEPGGCGGTLLAQMKPMQEPRYRVLNMIDAKVGDLVYVSLPAGHLWRAAFLAYLMPLVGLFAGAAMGLLFSGEDQAAVWGGGVGLFLGFLALKGLAGKFGSQEMIQMRVKLPGDCLLTAGGANER